MHILETPRLILRPPSHSDELLLHGLYSELIILGGLHSHEELAEPLATKRPVGNLRMQLQHGVGTTCAQQPQESSLRRRIRNEKRFTIRDGSNGCGNI